MSEALKSLYKEITPVALKAIKVFLWALSAIVILPCVFITHHFYPMWEEWGKDF